MPMVAREVIVAELQKALTEIEKKHKVKIILRELDVFDAEYVERVERRERRVFDPTGGVPTENLSDPYNFDF